MSIAKHVREDRARFGSHRTRGGGAAPSPWMISRRRWGDGGVQGMIRTQSLIVACHRLGKLDLDCRSRDDDALDGGA